MTDRGLPSADGSPACPFVAFEDDRDERADRPDHRHRCFADTPPAPRALAHQEAYCLSSAFPVCPVFQEWAQREAARARPGAPAAQPPTAATVTTDDPPAPGDEDVRWRERPDDTPIEERPRRNPPRDWAAPPPWAGGAAAGAGAAGAGRVAADGEVASEFLTPRAVEGQGLAGSPADRLAGGGSVTGGRDPERSGWRAGHDPDAAHGDRDELATDADPELAGLVGRVGGARIGGLHLPARGEGSGDGSEVQPPRRPAVSSTRDRTRDRERDRERERAAAERAMQQDGPSWERGRRYEAYPSIRTRAGLSGFGLPRVVVLFGALIVAALVLFFLPALLGVGGPEPDASASPSQASSAPTATPAPTPIPEPTPQVYVVKSGDTLSKIARSFGLTVEQIREANPSITDPNKIKVGDEIVIPLPPPDEVGGSAAPSP